MYVPVLKQGDFLIATLQAMLTDDDLVALRRRLVDQIGETRAKGVILDVTGMDIMDSFSVRTLQEIAHMIRLRGAATVIVGIQPEVAFSMVQLGLGLESVPTALDFEEGIEYLQSHGERPGQVLDESNA